MAKSVKLDNDTYIDSTGIVHNKTKLSDILTYSTDEKVVGTWIDGKPLYRKVYSTTSKANIDLSNLNYDYIEIIRTRLKVSGYTRNPYYTSSSDYFRTLIDAQKKLTIEASASSISNWTTVLEYTKTTD